MNKAEGLVGKEMTHKSLGRVNVLKVFDNSRTKVEVQVIQRAKGWDESLGKYRPITWSTPNLNISGEEVGRTIHSKINKHRNSQYGHEDVCHINELT